MWAVLLLREPWHGGGGFGNQKDRRAPRVPPRSLACGECCAAYCAQRGDLQGTAPRSGTESPNKKISNVCASLRGQVLSAIMQGRLFAMLAT